MRYLYSAIFYIMIPFILLYLKKRGIKNQNYNLFWRERLGFNLVNRVSKPIIWIHAVSVGETRALAKLIMLIEVNYPQYQLLITHMTPTGMATAKSLYPNAISHYLPYDLPHAMANFYKTFQPSLGLIMETEIWPNLIYYANRYMIPLYLINARLSDRSFSAYCKIKWMIKPVLNNLSGILSQDHNSANNFTQLGFSGYLEVVGNIKFDIAIDENSSTTATFLKQNIINKKIVVFASTRDGEEKLILDALPKNMDYLVLIIPRHPERFMEVQKLIIDKNLNWQKRSSAQPIKLDTQIMLGDSMGEMFAYYALSDIAVIGGSFKDFGGQNLLEPISLNKPVIFGPDMTNFANIAKNAKAYKCAVEANNISECFQIINQLFKNKEEYNNLSHNCTNFINHYQGASLAIMDVIKKHLLK